MRYSHRRLDADGEPVFRVNLADLRFTWQFDLASALRIILIRNETKRNPGSYSFDVDRRSVSVDAQVLYSYQINPQSVFYAGYSSSALDNDRLPDLRKTADTFFAKFSYAWRR